MNPERGLEELAVTAARVAEAVAQVRGRGTAVGGRVWVEVDAAGLITDGEISTTMQGLPVTELFGAVVDAHRSARAGVQAQVKELATEVHDTGYLTAMDTNINGVDKVQLESELSDSEAERRQLDMMDRYFRKHRPFDR